MNYRVVLLLAASAAAIVAAPAGGSSSQRVAFELLQFRPTGLVDAPPARGFDHPSPGDTLTATSAIYDNGGTHRIGRTSELCVVTVVKPMTMDCSLALIFSNGSELLVRGAFDPTRTPWRAIVVGGYGRYAGARGWVRETDLKGGERMTGFIVS